MGDSEALNGRAAVRGPSPPLCRYVHAAGYPLSHHRDPYYSTVGRQQVLRNGLNLLWNLFIRRSHMFCAIFAHWIVNFIESKSHIIIIKTMVGTVWGGYFYKSIYICISIYMKVVWEQNRNTTFEVCPFDRQVEWGLEQDSKKIGNLFQRKVNRWDKRNLRSLHLVALKHSHSTWSPRKGKWIGRAEKEGTSDWETRVKKSLQLTHPTQTFSLLTSNYKVHGMTNCHGVVSAFVPDTFHIRLRSAFNNQQWIWIN